MTALLPLTLAYDSAAAVIFASGDGAGIDAGRMSNATFVR
jgi:hypothetical protein